MNRHQKLKKLAAAIREYRGIFSLLKQKWIKPPNPGASDRVVLWLGRIGQDEAEIAESLKAIDGFKSLKEFDAWIQRQ